MLLHTHVVTTHTCGYSTHSHTSACVCVYYMSVDLDKFADKPLRRIVVFLESFIYVNNEAFNVLLNVVWCILPLK